MVAHNNTTKGKKTSKSVTRITISMDADVHAKLLNIKAEIIRIAKHDISMSKLITVLSRAAMSDYEDRAIANTIILEAKRNRAY